VVINLELLTRRANTDDLEKLCQIELECFGREAFPETQLAYFLKTAGFTVLVAEIEGEIVGFIVGAVEYRKDRIFGHIYSLDVSLKKRKKGVASRLLGEIEDILVESGVGMCYLEVRVDNVPALSLYRKRGYKIAESLPNYYGMGVNGFRLEKGLSVRQ